MKTVIDQNSAMVAQETALVPRPDLIDGRSETDRLSFLCGFARLINFYDADNTVQGNWSPFLMKDPVLLLASISKTNYSAIHKLYVNTCNALQREIQSTPVPPSAFVLSNGLFDQVMTVYLRIERWVYYMTLSQEDYDLKKYVITQIQETYSPLLWALLDWRTQLSIRTRGLIRPVHYDQFESFDSQIWTHSTGKDPYQQVLGLPMPGQRFFNGGTLTLPSAAEMWNTNFLALKNAGDSLFRFFHTIVRHAATEYEKVKMRKSPFPDTTLLRAFIDLLRVHQEQLNEISGKHLDFYYKDILKQSEQSAVADTVFITTVPAKTNAAFTVPAGTTFSAGLDANKNPIWFASVDEVSLNPAAVAGARTLSCWAAGAPGDFADMQLIAAPAAVQTDESGALLKWPTFGGTQTAASTLGFAFASPMLLLPEGERALTVTLNFKEAINPGILQTATYALSTAKGWMNVTPVVDPSVFSGIASVTVVTLTVQLHTADPAIVPFAQPQDGLNAAWPVMRMFFTQPGPLAQPPVLTSLNISVSVTGISAFQLYNDNGLLSTKTPFQLFGPIPGVNSNFLIGNSEMFSKPLQTFTLELDWDNLPQPPAYNSFSDYYVAYNTYLGYDQEVVVEGGEEEEKQETPPEANAASAALKKLLQLLGQAITGIINLLLLPLKGLWKGSVFVAGLLKKAGQSIAGWFKKEENTIAEEEVMNEEPIPIPIPVPVPYFNNGSFRVDFAALQNHTWSPLGVVLENGPQPPPEAGVAPDGAQYLFTTVPESTALSGKTIFAYKAPVSSTGASLFPANAELQNSALQYDATTDDGFIRMTLTAPGYGFGAPIYANVVSDVALQNALKISGSTKDDPVDPKTLLPAPNLPFAPKVKTITAGYTASQTYDVTASAGNYPLQCFYYTPFANYAVYDTTPETTFNGVVLNTLAGPAVQPSGVLLFPELAYGGVLYIELAGLIPDNYVSLFFELARSYGSTASADAPDYFYLSASGWKTLHLIKDSTNNFTCSGIIEVNIPGDIVTQSVIMPGTNAWIAIAVKGDPAAYALTVLMTTNGIELQRTGDTFSTSTLAPQLAAGIISKPQFPIPQIATIAQPFASFGGKAAEDQTQMNQRVSIQLKTKDRAMSNGDFFRLIRQQFSTVYYSKACFDADANVLTVYVVRGYDNASQPNAFTPLVSACEETDILNYLQKRTSLFPALVVSNFAFQYLSVSATITRSAGYTSKGVQDSVAQAINLFLSPWISADAQQVRIDSGVNTAEIAALINGVAGVQSVSDVTLALSPESTALSTTGTTSGAPPEAVFADPGKLIVTSNNHNIVITSAA